LHCQRRLAEIISPAAMPPFRDTPGFHYSHASYSASFASCRFTAIADAMLIAS
jgi:hypothetical protein